MQRVWIAASLWATSTAFAQPATPGFDTYKALKLGCDGTVAAVNTGIEQGHLEAYLLAARMFDAGMCVRKDLTRAAALLEEAARKGSEAALERLALKFALGQGVPQSYAMAGAWLGGKGMGKAPLTNEDYSRGYAGAVVNYVMSKADIPYAAAEVQVGADLTVELSAPRPLDAMISVVTKRGRAVPTGSHLHVDYGTVYADALRVLIEEAVATLPAPQKERLVDIGYKRSISFNFSDRTRTELIEERVLRGP